MTDQMLPEYDQVVARLYEVAQLMSDLKFKGDPSKTLAIRQQIHLNDHEEHGNLLKGDKATVYRTRMG